MLLAVGALAPPSITGCRAPGSQPPVSAARFDRLLQFYPELHSGRFLVLADFEDGKHLELFNLDDVSQAAHLEVHPRRGRPETGRAGLVFTSGSKEDGLVISNTSAKEWYLKRDWREYDLLLMSLEAPRHGLAASLTITSGTGRDELAAQAVIRLRKGWNVLRFDLAAIGERIAIDDVRELRLAVVGDDKPAAVSLDDILLTAHRVDLSGDSSNPDAGLYVRQVGRRWKIGAGGPGANFEITVAHGQIIEWFNLATDPFKLHNLLGGRPLGPTPVIDRGTGFVPLYESTDGNIAAQSQILEMNSVRVVVSSEWRGASGASAAHTASNAGPLHKGKYTIYRTGQIFVTLETLNEEGEVGSLRRGLAVPVPSWADDKPDIDLGPSKGDPRSVGAPAYAVARAERGDAALLFVPFDQGEAAGRTEAADGTGAVEVVEVAAPGAPQRLSAPATPSIVAVLPGTAEISTPAAYHLLLGNVADLSADDALARAASYVSPPQPHLSIGTWVKPDLTPPPRSAETPGYWPGSGCYVISPEGGAESGPESGPEGRAARGQVSLTLNGRDRPYFSPAFRILDDVNRTAWVYVDHLLFEAVTRDGEGNLLFQLPGTIRKKTLVEVLLRAPSADWKTESQRNP